LLLSTKEKRRREGSPGAVDRILRSLGGGS
jgi:hypothetical protein